MQEQQAILIHSTNHLIPALTLIFHSDEVEPSGHALTCLQISGSVCPAVTKNDLRRCFPDISMVALVLSTLFINVVILSNTQMCHRGYGTRQRWGRRTSITCSARPVCH